MTRLHWRSLRVQVLLWTALPLTIFLIAISLTGIGSHQASMRALAAEETERLANAVAPGLAAQMESYQVGLEAAAGALVHHMNDPASRDALIAQTSGVMGNIDLVLFDASGAIAGANGAPPSWAPAIGVGAGDSAIAHVGDYILLRADLSQGAGALVAAVPVQTLAFASYLGNSANLYGSTLALLDATGSPILTAGQAVEGSGMTSPASEAKGAEKVTATAALPGTDWTIVMREAWHSNTAPMLRFEQAVPFVLVIATAVSLLTLLFGLRLVVQPLRALAARAQRIGEGDFSAAGEPVGGVDEIEDARIALDRMAAQIRAHQRALEQQLHAVNRAQEEERARLARELHDETVQGLVALDHRLQKAQRALQRDPALLKDEVSAVRAMVHAEMEEVRRFSRGLRPAYLEDLGLCPALELLCEELGVDFSVTGAPRRLDPTAELSFFRIAQEAINNARRHAQARQIALGLAFLPTKLVMQVQDDGIGFAPPAHLGSLGRQGHFGLMGMEERAELIGAQLTLASSPGSGATITLSLDS
jgi:signal transduction histidine kinase